MKTFKLTLALALACAWMAPAAVAQYSTPSRDVDNPARQPYQAAANVVCFYGTSSATFASDSTTIKVPAGKRLVIETVTIDSLPASGQIPEAWVGVTAGGAGGAHHIPLQRMWTAAQYGGGMIYDRYQAMVSVRLYADPGTTVTLGTRRSSTAGTAADMVTSFRVSGYYVNLP